MNINIITIFTATVISTYLYYVFITQQRKHRINTKRVSPSIRELAEGL